tara:strand:- start:495 stop:767 length:273 start_codon:yes stop_codon:yes gene_type:complete
MQNSKEFLTAVEYVKKLKATPSNDEKGLLYGLYKQSIVGDVNIEQPSSLNLVAAVKWNNWSKHKGKSTHDAEVEYIKTVNLLIKKYGVNV